MKTCSKSSQCDDKERGQGKNRLEQLNFVKTNFLQTIKCSTKQGPSKISQNRYKMGFKKKSYLQRTQNLLTDADKSTNTKRNMTNGKEKFETNWKTFLLKKNIPHTGDKASLDRCG